MNNMIYHLHQNILLQVAHYTLMSTSGVEWLQGESSLSNIIICLTTRQGLLVQLNCGNIGILFLHDKLQGTSLNEIICSYVWNIQSDQV